MFIIIILFAFTIMLIFLYLAHGITFFGTNSDNQKQVFAASQIHYWRWPSDMHKYSKEKSRMKDAFILCLALMQRLLNDKTSDYPVVCLCAASNAVSSVLIYLISYKFWGIHSAILVFLFYITSMWPWQIALYGGHICVGQLFFLFSVLCLQLTEKLSPYQAIGWFVAAGVAFGLSQFSSASTRKFTILFLGAFFYSQRNWLVTPIQVNLDLVQRLTRYAPVFTWVILVLLLFFLSATIFSKPLIKAMYLEQAPSYLNKYIKNRQKFDINHYLKRAKDLIRSTATFCFFILLYFFSYLAIFEKNSFYSAKIPLLLGISSVFIFLTLPNILSNLRGYYNYSVLARGCGHFRFYKDYFAKLGKSIKENMRGAGMEWVIKYFSRISAFQFISYIFCLLFLISALFFGALPKNINWEVIGIIFLSMSPIIWAELTRAPQIGRSYFPGLHGQLVLIAYTVMQIQNKIIFGSGQVIFWFLVSGIVILSAIWNFNIFFSDVYPARMAVTRLVKKLKILRINKFYTYKTYFNGAFVDTINDEDLKNFEVTYINSLNEVKENNAYAVIPGISSKSFNMVSTLGQDFRSDELLNRLIDSRKIQDCSVARFKTFGNSKIWVNEDEVSTYRYLILRDVSDEDRWRGYAWILDITKIRKVLSEIYENSAYKTSSNLSI